MQGSRKGSARRGKTGGRAKPRSAPATPQQAWEQAVAAYEGNEPRRAQGLLAPLLDLPSVPGEVSLLAGLVEGQLGDAARAEEHLRRAVQLVPGRIEGWLGLGNAQHMQGRFDAAVDTFRRVLARSPDHPTALYNMAMAQFEHGRYRDALDSLERVLAVQPEQGEARRYRARVLARLRWADAARAAYAELLGEAPDDPHLRLEYAVFLEQDNEPEAAAQWLPADEALAGDRAALARAAELRAQLLARDGDREAALEVLQRARRETGQDSLGYREGAILDRLGRPDEAMAAFERGNRARAGTGVFRRMRSRGYLDYLAEKVERGVPASVAEDDAAGEPGTARRTPVFLVGLPRSGTTLLDRMLGAHPEAQVLEEFDSLRVAESAFAAGRTAEQARQAYWDYVERHVEVPEGRLLIDKNPLHAAHIDNLPRLFPDARVILALRHPYDAALSCYMQDFEPNPASVHFLELDSTARLCARLLEMLRQFEQARPQQAVRLRYEDLIADFTGEVTRVLRAIGLDWHDDVARYAERSRATGMVSTPSYEQVTRGLYRSAMGRWQRYDGWLAPFREHLGPLLPAFGYGETAPGEAG